MSLYHDSQKFPLARTGEFGANPKRSMWTETGLKTPTSFNRGAGFEKFKTTRGFLLCARELAPRGPRTTQQQQQLPHTMRSGTIHTFGFVPFKHAKTLLYLIKPVYFFQYIFLITKWGELEEQTHVFRANLPKKKKKNRLFLTSRQHMAGKKAPCHVWEGNNRLHVRGGGGIFNIFYIN